MDWLDLFAGQGTLKSLLQHHTSKPSILPRSALFVVQRLHPYMTAVKTIALTIWTFTGKVMFLLSNMLSRFVIAFLLRSKHLLISWLQSPSSVILKPKKIKSVSASISTPPSVCHEVMEPDAMGPDGFNGAPQIFTDCFPWASLRIQSLAQQCPTVRVVH